ncbi:MAG: glycosyl transferase [Candidatus Levybacteria bacterium RIFCSPLOWO2_02_FULL_36_8b]|nr:MAG: glycosyl transferase [Candidatus Levybacteria bacterium RIFCSPLOWO2_02_FULL_36_8b]
MKLSIIIPVFNEEKTISEMLRKVNEIKISGVEKQVIVINDGSTDATASTIQNSKLKIQNFEYTEHSKNQGKGAAVRTGIKNATGDYIIIQDADLEYNPEDIRKLVMPVLESAIKVVYGTRLKRLPNFSKEERTPQFLLHYIGNKFLSLLTSILYGQWITDMETCYKLFPKKAVEGMRLNARRFEFEPEITAKLLKKGYKILEIPISTKPRGYDEGKKLNTFRDGTIALWNLLKYRFVE